MTEPLRWETVPILAIATETPAVKRYTLRTGWTRPFRAGQSIDVRLTAADGYQAQRSYSIASSPAACPLIDIMVERLEDGEVSGFFHDVAQPGDEIEMRGPIGGPFTWAPAEGGPLFMAGGGSGVVPLLSMLRARSDARTSVPAALLYSAQRVESAIARDELATIAERDPLFHFRLHVTRASTPAAGAVQGRIDARVVGEALALLGEGIPRCFVCGSNPFVGHVSDLLLDAGVAPGRIRTERFG